MGNINFTIDHFEEIVKRGYSMDQVILLTWIKEDKTDLDISSRSAKVQALYQSLIRKGLITEANVVTALGNQLLDYMETKDSSKFAKKRTVAEKKETPSDFDLWWKSYPGTPTFIHKGMKFEGDRSLRVNVDKCRAKFASILEEGEYTAADLIAALNYEVLQKKENSVKQKVNKMTYMQNSLTYLNQRSYEPFIELIKEGVTITEVNKPRGGTDI